MKTRIPSLIFCLFCLIAPLSAQIDFSADIEPDRIVVSWVIESNHEYSYFLVERSSNELEWNVIASVDGTPTGSGVSVYRAIDEQPITGTIYYRLRKVTPTGSESFSDKVFLEYKTGPAGDEGLVTLGDLKSYPNPATDVLHVEYSNPYVPYYELVLTDASGKVLELKRVEEQATNTTFDLSDHPHGMYFVRMIDGYQNQGFSFYRINDGLVE